MPTVKHVISSAMHQPQRARSSSMVGTRRKKLVLDSPHWCGRLLYNIPRGTILLLLPAMTMFFIGIGCLIADPNQDPLQDTYHVGIIFAIIGSVLVVPTAFFCTRSILRWRKYAPWAPPNRDERSYSMDIMVEIEGTEQYEDTDRSRDSDIQSYQKASTSTGL